jgi:hypothetical protein
VLAINGTGHSVIAHLLLENYFGACHTIVCFHLNIEHANLHAWAAVICAIAPISPVGNAILWCGCRRRWACFGVADPLLTRWTSCAPVRSVRGHRWFARLHTPSTHSRAVGPTVPNEGAFHRARCFNADIIGLQLRACSASTHWLEYDITGAAFDTMVALVATASPLSPICDYAVNCGGGGGWCWVRACKGVAETVFFRWAGFATNSSLGDHIGHTRLDSPVTLSRARAPGFPIMNTVHGAWVSVTVLLFLKFRANSPAICLHNDKPLSCLDTNVARAVALIPG